MNETNIAESTFRLLVVLDALITERSVTRAARLLAVSQPAVSHALRRLRALYGDDLVVRGPDGLVATPLALELAPVVRLGLSELRRAIARDFVFDPRHARRSFSVATVDHPLLTGVADLLAVVKREAPGVDVRIRPLGPGLAEALASGALDTVLAGGEVEQQLALDRGLMRARIASEGFVCILRRGHPALRRRFDLDAFCALPHLLVSTAGRESGMVDSALAALGRKRRVAVTVPDFVGAPVLVARSDLVASVPRSIAEFGTTTFGLALRPPPLDLPRGDAYLWWHRRFQNDPGHRWWRRVLMDAFAPYRRDGDRAPGRRVSSAA